MNCFYCKKYSFRVSNEGVRRTPLPLKRKLKIWVIFNDFSIYERGKQWNCPLRLWKAETVIFDVFGNSILWSVFSHKSKLYHSIPISDRIMKGVFENIWSRVSKILENILFTECRVTFGIHKHVSFALAEAKYRKLSTILIARIFLNSVELTVTT